MQTWLDRPIATYAEPVRTGPTETNPGSVVLETFHEHCYLTVGVRLRERGALQCGGMRVKSVSIEIEYRRTADLKPYGNNARTHSKKQVRQIAESIQRFGFTNPILISDR